MLNDVRIGNRSAVWNLRIIVYVAFFVLKLSDCVCRLHVASAANSEWQMQIQYSVWHIACANWITIYWMSATFHFKLSVVFLKLQLAYSHLPFQQQVLFFRTSESEATFKLQTLKYCTFRIACVWSFCYFKCCWFDMQVQTQIFCGT